ncbi:MAG: hypothetical protein C0602_04135 [Denitrovibrio sp.]|nr:MAG: hypothetical protein C0602_04135 [Denitrovibrio sp.]
MSTFLMFLYSKPFFAVCFVFQSIPFWVPLLAVFAGADPLLMIGLSALSVMSKAYIDSEISFKNPITLMLKYFLASPLLFTLKLTFALVMTALFMSYGLQGVALDKGIAAVLIVYLIMKLYFREKNNNYWNVKGLGTYRFYSIAGKLLSALLWLAFFTVELGPADSFAVASAALFISFLTFYKVNEGLL